MASRLLPKEEQLKDGFLLEMTDIHKGFPGVKALDGVQLKVKHGSVHALMGENGAGKSTLMKCLFGIYKKDQGTIKLDGQVVDFKNSKDALNNGVSMVHQELNQVLTTRIMDNIWLGRFPKKGIVIDEAKMYVDTKKIFEELDIQLDPKQKMKDLPVSEKQMVEIAKAVSYNSKILVMDEPTSSLTEKEVNHLFKIIRALKAKGIGIIYISHKMQELAEIADDVTVFRDGKWIATHEVANISTDDIIKEMVGRDLSERFPKKTNRPGETILNVKNLSTKYAPFVEDVSFELRKGEILGVAGLVGARRTDLLEAIFGSRTLSGGEMYLHDKKIDNSTPIKAIKNGFALVTEERRETGIFGELSVKFNSTISTVNIDKYLKYLVALDDGKIKGDTEWVIDSMNVKTPKMSTKIQSLSGGNQQKVIIGRWLLSTPEVLLLDEPTRGIDVGAKFEIYQLMIDLANQEKAVIMVSSEMAELFGVTDRILVMSNGRMAGIVETANSSQEEVMKLAAKHL